MLTLPIKKKWFDMIKDGIKKEEYREIKPYWTRRFIKITNGLYHSDNNQFLPLSNKEYKKIFNHEPNYYILLRNGYGENKPTIKCKIDITRDYGNPEWGAEPNKLYYVLKILSVEEVK